MCRNSRVFTIIAEIGSPDRLSGALLGPDREVGVWVYGRTQTGKFLNWPSQKMIYFRPVTGPDSVGLDPSPSGKPRKRLRLDHSAKYPQYSPRLPEYQRKRCHITAIPAVPAGADPHRYFSSWMSRKGCRNANSAGL